MKNCWEVKNCQRQPGGLKVHELGECPAATAPGYDGRNRGKNGGRYCWRISGSLCGGKIQGTWAEKLGNCVTCDFFKTVKKEEGSAFAA